MTTIKYSNVDQVLQVGLKDHTVCTAALPLNLNLFKNVHLVLGGCIQLLSAFWNVFMFS